MNRLIYSVVMIALLLMVGMVSADEQDRLDPQAGSVEDNRTVPVWTPAERFSILQQMQHFYGGLQIISAAPSSGDMRDVAPVARPLGAGRDIKVLLKGKRPLAFELMTSELPTGFDQVALDAETLGPVSHTLLQFSDAWQPFIGCHDADRIAVTRGP